MRSLSAAPRTTGRPSTAGAMCDSCGAGRFRFDVILYALPTLDYDANCAAI